MSSLPVEPPSRRRPRPLESDSGSASKASPAGFGGRLTYLLAILWAAVWCQPGWVLSLVFHVSVLSCLSAVMFHGERRPANVGIEASLGDGSGGGGGDGFETVLTTGFEAGGGESSVADTLSSAIVEQTASASAARALGELEGLGMGDGGEGEGSGGGSGGGHGGGRGPGLGAGFFGTQGEGKTFVFVVDASGSMEGERFRRAIAELVQSINKLKAEQSFYVYFFNDKTFPLYDPRPAKGMQRATPNNKMRASRWIRSRRPSSTTDPHLALEQAIEMKPDVIFLLTDGELDDPVEVRHMIQQRNKSGVVIHTIAFQNEEAATTLETIARENHGTFRFVK